MVVSAKSCELIKLLNENQVSPESDQENIFLMLPSISSLLSDIELEVFFLLNGNSSGNANACCLVNVRNETIVQTMIMN